MVATDRLTGPAALLFLFTPVLAADLGFAAGLAAFVDVFFGAAFVFVAPVAAFLGAFAFFGASDLGFFAAAGFLVVDGLAAAGSFFASFTVPEGPTAT